MSGGRKRVRKVRAKEEEEGAQGEDRISKLPDDLIHRILSLIDATEVIQTSLWSTRWRQVWKSLHHLNFDRVNFSRLPDFIKFVTQFLSHRNHHSDISVITINCTYGSIARSFVKMVSAYAASHNVQRLDISSSVHAHQYSKCGGLSPIPHTVFSCPSLKQLSLKGRGNYLWISSGPKSSWNLPALTTLFIEHFIFAYCCDNHSSKSVDLFSNLPNLKNLTLIDCYINGTQVFNIISPQLENLDITSKYRSSDFVVSAPKLSSFKYTCDYGLLISTSDLHCLDKIYINIAGSRFIVRDPEEKKRVFREIMNMFNQLQSAKFVTLTVYTIEVLSWILELLEKTCSPFSNMKCLKIVGCHHGHEISTLSTDVINYFRHSSPNCTFINESGKDFQDA